MKLYHFNPHNWGEEYYVMSDSKENAYNAFLEHLGHNVKKEEEDYKDSPFKITYEKEKLEYWQNYNANNLPEGFTINEYGMNEVIESEIA